MRRLSILLLLAACGGETQNAAPVEPVSAREPASERSAEEGNAESAAEASDESPEPTSEGTTVTPQPSGGPVAPPDRFTCQTPESHLCIECAAGEACEARVDPGGCLGMGGLYSNAPCSRESAVGTCANEEDGTLGVLYGPHWNARSARRWCRSSEGLSGTWQAIE